MAARFIPSPIGTCRPPACPQPTMKRLTSVPGRRCAIFSTRSSPPEIAVKGEGPMKLATLRSQSRDGMLVVVSRDLKRMTSAADIAPSLRVALDRWSECKPRLEERYHRLMDGLQNAMPFDETLCHSPLPRSFQWLDGTAYESHRYRMTKGRPAPDWFQKEPPVYQGRSDGF